MKTNWCDFIHLCSCLSPPLSRPSPHWRYQVYMRWQSGSIREKNVAFHWTNLLMQLLTTVLVTNFSSGKDLWFRDFSANAWEKNFFQSNYCYFTLFHSSWSSETSLPRRSGALVKFLWRPLSFELWGSTTRICNKVNIRPADSCAHHQTHVLPIISWNLVV